MTASQTRRGQGRGTGHTGTGAESSCCLTRLAWSQTLPAEVENCRLAHGLGLVRRRGAAQAAAIASRYIKVKFKIIKVKVLDTEIFAFIQQGEAMVSSPPHTFWIFISTFLKYFN